MITIIHNTVITVGENKVEQGKAAVSAHAHMFESRDAWWSKELASRLIVLTYRYFFSTRRLLFFLFYKLGKKALRWSFQTSSIPINLGSIFVLSGASVVYSDLHHFGVYCKKIKDYQMIK